MSLPTPDENADRCLAAVDVRRSAAIDKMARYALTGVWGTASRQMGPALWPWYQDADSEYADPGRSNKILNANRQKKARFLTGDIEPDSSGVKAVTSAARKAFFKARFAGKGNEQGSWRPHVYGFFDDFDFLGIGCCYISTVIDHDTDKDAVSVQHVPLQHVLYDPFARNPQNARWCCVRFVVSYDEAYAMYPEVAQRLKVTLQRENTGQPLEAVPIIHYYDIGIAGKDPSCTVWVGDFSEPHVEHKKSPYGRELPMAFMVGNLLPNARFPVGGVFTQMKSQMMANKVEEGVVTRLDNSSMRLWASSKVNPEDWKKYMLGELRGNMRLDEGFEFDDVAKQVMADFSGQSLSNADMQAMEWADKQFNEDAGLSETNQGNVLEGGHTLGEVESLKAEASANRAFDDQNVKNGLVELVQKVFMVAKLFDDSPVDCTVILPTTSKSVRLTVNKDAGSSCKQLFDQPSEVTLDVSSLTASDAATKANERLLKLERLAALIVQGGPMAVMKYGDKLIQEGIDAIGEDPEDWIQEAPPMMPGAPMAPQMGQPVPGGPPMPMHMPGATPQPMVA